MQRWQQPAWWEAEEDISAGGHQRIRAGRRSKAAGGLWLMGGYLLGGERGCENPLQGSVRSVPGSLTSVSLSGVKASKSFPAVLQTSAPIDSIQIISLPHLFSTARHWRSPTLTFSSGSCVLCALGAPCRCMTEVPSRAAITSSGL